MTDLPVDQPRAPSNVELSVILPAKNAAATIGVQLRALSDQEWDGTWEVIVADNGSTDGTCDVVCSFMEQDPRIRLVLADEVRGAGHARNVAMAEALGDAFAFCDADDQVSTGWVRALGEGLRQHDFVTGPVSFDALNAPWIRTAYYQSPPQDVEVFAEVLPFAATCNLGARRIVVDRIGGFDTSFLTGQDMEFCLRAWLAGFELEFLPEAVVEYRYRESIGALWNRSFQYGLVAPRIARLLSDAGTVRPPHLQGLRNWIWLIRNLPSLRSQSGRGRWVVVAGNRVGRIVGSARAGYLYL